ncbi:hypothetical protein GP476_10690 [Aeromonas dhakensis]|uniref:hypothetical protein n=1 Tax=Aeromonas dhakensis TaxID=196024 RepID=UPI0021B381F9|nr:hypothetical protein [Aeromonas dhakensis]UXB11889.1 hypothetical protein GP476_10690 [Aeromonas dhakensis]
MKDKFDNLKLFIAEQKAYFLESIKPDVNFKWDDDSWSSDSEHKGVFSGRSSGHLEFKSIKSINKGIFLDDDVHIELSQEINYNYREFMKSFIVFLIKLKNHKISLSALNRDNLLLKRLYIRMLINGDIAPTVQAFSNEIISQSMLAHCSAMSNLSNAADSQTAMRKLCEYINRLGITFNPIEYKVTQKRPSSKSTEAATQAKIKAFHNAEFAEEADEDESKKLITIQTFLNIVAVRGMVTTDGEKVLLNMLMLLMVTGFRFGELERLKADALKRLDVEDKEVIAILKNKGLKNYFLGIVYVGEKQAGHRTHWVEPLAIDLVETIFEDTLNLTRSIRNHLSYCRGNGFSSLLPIELHGTDEISLDEIISHIIESSSITAQTRGCSAQRDYAKKALAKFGIEPSRIDVINGRQKIFYYSSNGIEQFLKKKISSNKELNSNFIYNFTDSKSGTNISYNIEDILFIVPEGSASLVRSSVIKPLASRVSMRDMLKFVGANDGLGGTSLFKKYNLVDEDGNFPELTTHMPRHTINTFLAIAGITDHLQAVMMGRVDISQNTAYQHLAIEQRALASEVVTFSSQMVSFMNEPELDVSIVPTPLDLIKNTGEISINQRLNIGNAIAQNAHTFTTREDKASFLEDIFESCSLDLMAGLGEAWSQEESKPEKNLLLNRHADLHPLDFGSCMRKLQAWSCPYSMKCQDGSACPYFTVIGRADDTVKLERKISLLQQQTQELNNLLVLGTLTQAEHDELILDFSCRSKNLQRVKEGSRKIESTKVKFNLIDFDLDKKPKTLATIFAVEHKKLEKANNA